MDYDGYALQYSTTRWAVSWVTDALVKVLNRHNGEAVVVEIGCGTANYSIALLEHLPAHRYYAFDLSPEMLKVARSRTDAIIFSEGDADSRFPYAGDFAHLSFCVDVVHHLKNYGRFFGEAFRVLKNRGTLCIVTDSTEDIRNRSLIHFFPELLEIELERYPTIEELEKQAVIAGFSSSERFAAKGYYDLEERFLNALAGKCSSALRLLSESAYQSGLLRVKEAAAKGGKWLSRYTVLTFAKRSYDAC